MPGEVVAVDHDVEVKVKSHRLGHRLAPRNPLSVNNYVVQRYRLALTRGGPRDAVVVRERVDDGQRRWAC